MARELRAWIAAALLGCLVLGIVYLPPRAAPLFRRRFREPPPPTPYHLRVQQLADEWREAEIERRLLEYRERLSPELARRRSMDLSGPAVLFEGPDTLSDSARRVVNAGLDTIWSRLGLGVSKVSVGVVLDIDFGVPKGRNGEPAQRRLESDYLLPDSSDRSTCVAHIPVVYWGRQDLLRQSRPALNAGFESFLLSGLGPCAFYAAFGTPGRAVARWLGGRQFDLALRPEWQRDGRGGAEGWVERLLDPTQPWFLAQLHRYPPPAVACMAGRRDACAAAVLESNAIGDSAPRIVTKERRSLRLGLPYGDQYLADAVRVIGRERFQRFWSSEQQVDTALATAVRMPVGEWTRGWQANLVPRFRLGPSVSTASVLLSLLLAAIALAFVLRTAARRQVR